MASVALGLGIFAPRFDRSFNDVFKRADEELYKNKEKMKKDLRKNGEGYQFNKKFIR